MAPEITEVSPPEEIVSVLEYLLSCVVEGCPVESPMHVCGPDSGCDNDCVTWANHCAQLHRARQLCQLLKRKATG